MSRFSTMFFRSVSGKLQSDRGFALVAVLLLLVPIVLLSVSMLGLASISLRNAEGARHQADARANARLAVALAIDQLQSAAGPDQRITATAGILDASPDTPEIDGVPQSRLHWVGVWPSARPDGRSWIVSDDNGPVDQDAAGLLDTRPPASWTTAAGKRDSAIAWLVSSPTAADPLENGDGDETLMLSARGGDPEVRVPVIQCDENGSLAWWISDEGVKAHIAVDHDLHDTRPDASAPGEGFRWLTSVPGLQPGAIDPNWEPLAAATPRLLSLESLDLSANGAGRERFHHHTVHSTGILADTMRGGLRKDLSAYLLEGPQAPISGHIGLGDDSRLVGPLDRVDARLQRIRWEDTRRRDMGPRFGLLRHWWQLSEQRDNLPLVLPNWDLIRDDAFLNIRQHDLDNQTRSSVKPLMVEGSVFYNITYQESTDDQLVPRLHIYPRVVLWNPFNVSIDVPDLVCYVRVGGVRRIELRGATPGEAWIRMPGFPNARYGQSVTAGSWVFLLEGTRFEPGQCLVFSHARGGSTRYDNDLISMNRLSATRHPGSSNFHLDDCFWTSRTGGSRVRLRRTSGAEDPEFRFMPGGPIEDLALSLKAYPGGVPPNTVNSRASREQWINIQNVNYHDAGGDLWQSDSAAGWRTTDFRPLLSFREGRARMPYYKTRDGARLRWVDETAANLLHAGIDRGVHDTGLIAQFNVRHHLCLRTPVEALLFNDPKIFGDYVRDVWHPATGWENTTPIPLGRHKFGGNPFAAPQDWASDKYVLIDLPHPAIGLTSLGQFQHAPVSAYSWQPTYAIGNSWADPRVPATGTSPRWSGFGGWNNATFEGIASRSQQFRDLIQRSDFAHTKNTRGTVPDQLLVDLSYELNHQLWDRFYLSGATTAEIEAFLRDGGPSHLRNARLRPIGSGSSPESTFHHGALQLAVAGSFNINSTSIEAWRALLLSTRDRAPDGASDSRNRSAYPRLLASADGAADGKGPVSFGGDGGDAWSGYRSLSDDDVGRLATEIVREVKMRGPFLSLSDFINRRLIGGEAGRCGPLQAAIDRAGLNQAHDEYRIPRVRRNPAGPNALRHQAKAYHKTAGATGYLQQADLLQPLGPVLAARSDTFKIRAYGESRSIEGSVRGRAWCEVVVQRIPSPLASDVHGLNPDRSHPLSRFGRRFIITNFRWLHPSEI